MKLGEFLSNVPKSSAKKEPVHFVLLGRNAQTAEQVETEGFACFGLVSDKDHEAADLAAMKSLRETNDGVVVQDVIDARQRAYFLAAALRDFDDPIQRFAEADQLQAHMPRRELKRLERDYETWLEKNYPPKVSKQERQELKDEARGK